MLKLPKRRQKKLRWGAAGCGRFTEQAFLPTMMLFPKAKVMSVYSHDLKRARALADKFGVPNAFDDYDQFLASEIDAVYVGSANSDHYDQVIRAAKAGKHILCDKPVSLTAAEAFEMVRVCEENNVKFFVNYPYRFHPMLQKAKELIQSKNMGQLISVNANFNINLLPGENFRYKSAHGGGALMDIGTHILDTFRYLGGEIVSIEGVMDNVIYQAEVEDYAAGIAKFEKGGYGIFNVSFNAPKAFNRIEIILSRGALSVENLINQKSGSTKLHILFDGETKKVFRKRANKMYRCIRSVNNSVLKNLPAEVPGTEGAINMKLMEIFEQGCMRKKIL